MHNQSSKVGFLLVPVMSHLIWKCTGCDFGYSSFVWSFNNHFAIFSTLLNDQHLLASTNYFAAYAVDFHVNHHCTKMVSSKCLQYFHSLFRFVKLFEILTVNNLHESLKYFKSNFRPHCFNSFKCLARSMCVFGLPQ